MHMPATRFRTIYKDNHVKRGTLKHLFTKDRSDLAIERLMKFASTISPSTSACSSNCQSPAPGSSDKGEWIHNNGVCHERIDVIEYQETTNGRTPLNSPLITNATSSCQSPKPGSGDKGEWIHNNGVCHERIDVIEYQGTTNGTTPLNSPAITNVIKPIEVTELDVPFSFRMPEGGFLVPRKMHVMLIPAPNAFSFSVNFFCKDEYLFQMRVDFPGANGADKRGAVVRNNTFGGQWQREERQMARFPFTPGMQSEMKIVAAMGGLKVLIDGSHFCDFHYYSTGPIPTQTTETTIVGDVSIQKFEFWNT